VAPRTRRANHDRATDAVRRLAVCATALHESIKDVDPQKTMPFVRAKPNIDEMQEHLNALRHSIKHLSRPTVRNVRWRVRDGMWRWPEFVTGFLVGGFIAFFGTLAIARPYSAGQSFANWTAPAVFDVTTSMQTRDVSQPWFQVGDEVMVIFPGQVRVRRTPGYVDKPEEDSFYYASEGERFTIIGNPWYADEIWWCKVSNSQCYEGWIAQNRSTGEAILGYP